MSTPLPFRPALALGNAHVQTIWPSLLRRVSSVAVQRQAWRRKAPDIGVIDMVLSPERPERPGVLLLHGLEGSGDASYIRGLMAALFTAGFNVAALEFHSCGPSPSVSPQLYHSGRTDEIAFAIEGLRERWLGAPLAACGFSLGGNALLKYLGEQQHNTPLVAAVGISVPFDLAACASSLDGPGVFAKLYRRRFLKSLCRKGAQVAQSFDVGFTAEQVYACKTLRAFDDLVTAPLFGFADAEDYWQRNSSAPFLPKICRPTLILAAKDDPFIPHRVIPRDAIAANTHLHLKLSERGGHTGFLEGTPWRPRYWTDSVVVDFLQSQLSG